MFLFGGEWQYFNNKDLFIVVLDGLSVKILSILKVPQGKPEEYSLIIFHFPIFSPQGDSYFYLYENTLAWNTLNNKYFKWIHPIKFTLFFLFPNCIGYEM